MAQNTNVGKEQVDGGGHNKERPRDQRDLEERTARFAEAVVRFAGKVPRSPVTLPLISQLVRAGTSPGANYAEADEAVSRNDFRHRIAICKKEARETKHWLRTLVAAVPEMKDAARPIWQEAKELHLIFAAIHRNCKSDD